MPEAKHCLFKKESTKVHHNAARTITLGQFPCLPNQDSNSYGTPQEAVCKKGQLGSERLSTFLALLDVFHIFSI